MSRRLTGKFKIDLNVYPSESYPVALFKQVATRWFKWWEHCESFKTKNDAREAFKKMNIEAEIDGLPEYLN